MKKWYAIYVVTGAELEVRNWLCKRLSMLKVLVPCVERYEWKKGVRFVVSKTLYPGYVLIHCEGIEMISSVLRENSKIFGMVGDGDTFNVVKDKELEILLRLVDDNGVIRISDVVFDSNGLVCSSGPLVGLERYICKINKRKMRAYLSFNELDPKSVISVGLHIKSYDWGNCN